MENSVTVCVPFFDVNDIQGTVCEICVEEGAHITADECICKFETSKSTSDIIAPSGGYIALLCNEGMQAATGAEIAYIFSDYESYSKYISDKDSANKAPTEDDTSVQKTYYATNKAQKKAEELGIAIADVAEALNIRNITSKDIDTYFVSRQNRKNKYIFSTERINPNDRERVLIIGAGKGAEIVIDILMDDKDKYVVGVVDSFAENFTSYSVPLYTCDIMQMPDVLDRGIYDTVLVSIGSDFASMKFRAELHEQYASKGILFTNAIGRNVNIRRAVKIGTNNIIMHNSYIGTGTNIGSDNVISYGAMIGHHNTIGDHNLFAPGFTTAGCVSIGSRSVFMTGVKTRSLVTIGDGVILGVGTNVDGNIADNTRLDRKVTGSLLSDSEE